MTKSVDSDISETPDLVPISELTEEWIDDYLNENATPRGEKIPSLAVYYPREAPYQFRFIFSGIQRERIEQHKAKMKVTANMTSRSDVDDQTLPLDQSSQDEPSGKEGKDEVSSRGGSEESLPSVDSPTLPDLELPIDATADDFEDTYYANLLRRYPERILLTLEHLNPDQASDKVTAISYTIDPPIDAGNVQHYRSKFQTGASASVSATSGSVTLSMWRWFRDVRNVTRLESLGSQLTVAGAGIVQPSLQHSDFPNKSTYDVNVTGNQNGSEYTISGSWVLGS